MPTVESLELEALKLAPVDRTRLLERLLASLDTDAQIDAAWDRLADEREAKIESGAVTPIALAEVVARLEARYRG
ncbi:MAG: addiction module protein [Betaproteobacteria bacterium]